MDYCDVSRDSGNKTKQIAATCLESCHCVFPNANKMVLLLKVRKRFTEKINSLKTNFREKSNQMQSNTFRYQLYNIQPPLPIPLGQPFSEHLRICSACFKTLLFTAVFQSLQNTFYLLSSLLNSFMCSVLNLMSLLAV